ncbi:hypothetical protein ACXVUM_12160 [Williamsia sp. SKLECPSW1]
MDRSTSIFAPTPEQAQRRRQVAAAILTTLFCAVLYGGTYGLAALLVFLGWCA